MAIDSALPASANSSYSNFEKASADFQGDVRSGNISDDVKLTNAQNKLLLDNGIDTEDDGPVKKGGGKAGGSGGGWLLAMAKAMGKLADAKAASLDAKIQALPEDAKPGQMLEVQAESQEFSLMMNAFTNVLKTLGEGNANSVRKS
jgi:hypothetical protein